MSRAIGWLGSAVVLAASLVIAGALTLGIHTSPWRLVPWLTRHGSPVHGVIAGWLIVAPLFLVGTAALRHRSPWPWVVATTLFLLAVTIVVARFPHLVSTGHRVLLGAVVVAALASVVTAFPASSPDTGQSA